MSAYSAATELIQCRCFVSDFRSPKNTWPAYGQGPGGKGKGKPVSVCAHAHEK